MDPHLFDQISKTFAQRRLSRRKAVARGAGLAAAGLAAVGLGAPAATARQATPSAGSATPPAGTAGTKIEFLFVQSYQRGSISAKSGSTDTYELTLEDGLGQTLFFSDRPERIVGAAPTPNFLKGMSFTPANPPNAALVVQTAPGAEDIAVLELTNPTYDTATHTATYDAKALKDWEDSLAMGFKEAPTDVAKLHATFETAHLFIDDCADGDIACVTSDETRMGTLQNQGFCYNWWAWGCEPCKDYSAECNATFSACKGQCHAFECYGSFGGGGYCG